MFIVEDWTCCKCGKFHENQAFIWAAMKVGLEGIDYICINCFYNKHENAKATQSGCDTTLDNQSN